MAFKATAEQAKIINARNTSLLVSAAAGSGKTAVLVERIVSLVCDEKNPVDIDRILVVTFTQAAAAEMKERVLKRINEKLEEDPENEHLQKQVTLVHQALITTIDSFCLDVVRNHFQEVGIEPDFRVADEGEAKLIRQDVLSRVLEKAYADNDPEFINCVETFCPGNSDAALEELIVSLCGIADSYPWPEDYLEERRNDHSISSVEELKGSELEKAVLKASYGYILYAISYIESAIRLCEDHDFLANYIETFDADREYFERIASVTRTGSLEDMYSLMGDAYSAKGKLKAVRTKTDEDKEIKELFGEPAKKFRDEAWKMIDKMILRYYSFPLEEQVRMISESGKAVNVLIDLAISYYREYAAEKHKKHVVDFSDMSHMALNILAEKKTSGGKIIPVPTDAALEYRDRFAEVMTDEYQDSNLIQEIILSALSAEDIGRYDRFIVGDVKQSIYSFRQARPDLFIEKQEEYTKIPPRMEVDLSGNFRSRTEVIDSVNRVFERIMHKETGGIEYDADAALIAKAEYPENTNCKTKLIIYDNKMMEEAAEAEAASFNDADGDGGDFRASAADFMDDVSDKSELEAVIVASQIKELLKTQRISDGNKDNPGLRNISFKDIVILRRSTGSVTEVYRKVFADMGIPFYAEGKNGYFKTTEVSLLLQYLRVLSNPLDDVPLYAVMHSVFGGFDENEIALIRAGRIKNHPLYESLLMASERMEDSENAGSISDSLREKVCAFLDSLDKYRKLSGYLTVRQLLDKITSDFRYIEMVGALPGGQGRSGNVQMLLVMASSYEKSSYLGLNDFIRYIDSMEKFEVDSGEVSSASESADVVRMMTIHKSKGLQFPIVIFAGLGRRFNLRDLSDALLADNKLGLGCRYTDTARRLRMKTLRYNAVSDKKRVDSVSEEMRLLYVAMTRACEKLIMIGGVGDAAKVMENCLNYPDERLSYGYFQSADCYLDLILPVAGCKEVLASIDLETVDAEKLYLEEKKRIESDAGGVTEFTMAESGDLSLADMGTLEELQKKFSYVYPYGYFENLYTKTTVSELKMAAMAEKDEGAYDLMEHGEDETAVPVFAGGNTSRIYDDKEEASASGKAAGAGSEFIITGTERGNAYHRCMQLLSWDRILGPVIGTVPENYDEYSKALNGRESEAKEFFEKFWDEELSAGHISEKTHAAVATFKILTFIKSELSYRMWRAESTGKLKREQPFVYGIPASRLLDPEHRNTGSEALDKEILMIQGIIDGYFVEDEKIVLLDYKTDSVTSMDELWKRYETQMDYYKEAIESLEHLPVTERYLYSFKLGTC
ncbi:MAG: helicase-exonuclease AddAB subunit AddA [Lachnospiraceae bacterium]|nr:helicase-exonuclease AddAB subunit AddA [Lachnospiraceae bacterium]